MKILITDADSRKAYDIINILKNVYNYELILFSSRETHFPLQMIYGQKVYDLRIENGDDFTIDLNNALGQVGENEDEFCYMAISEKPTLQLYDYFERKEKYYEVINSMLPDVESFQLARNKKEFQKYCESHHLPVPRSYDDNVINELNKEFRPVIAKLNIGSGSVGMKYLERKDQIHLLNEIDHGEYLIQEKIESDRKIYGAFFLCLEGEIISYHGHRRIRTFPEKGGVTVFSKADYDPVIKNIGAKLLKKLNWNGFAMIEFMYDLRDESWKIIELNPRLWGSVMLSEFCNASLLVNYIKLCEGKLPVQKEIITDRFIRWIFPFDLLNFLKGKIGFSEFCALNRNNTCYINFTYGGWSSNILFQLFFTLNMRSIRRYFKKIFS
jgi:glutathione synthase/RimK-type ligase-like ATP-grasp enzyme